MRTQPDGKKAMASSAYTAFLRLLGDSKWASKRALYLWPVSADWRNHVIRSLLEDELITSQNLNIKRKKRIEKTNDEEVRE